MIDKLLLVPTAFECRFLDPDWIREKGKIGFRLELCGFGLVMAGIRTSYLLEHLRPREVILMGIAGGFENQIPIGQASEFSLVHCFGIGVGSGREFQSARDLGWKQWEGNDPIAGDLNFQLDPIGDSFQTQSDVANPSVRTTLLSCTSASASLEEANWRREQYPDVSAEDMESFAVAVACAQARIPLRILRGISNVVGDRDHRHWMVSDAMRSAASLLDLG